eukprot:gene2602-3562_t
MFGSKTFSPRTSFSEERSDEDEQEIIFSGYMMKRGQKWKSWKKRWFVLRSDKSLSYYSKEKDEEPSGTLILTGCLMTDLNTNDEEEMAKIFRKQEKELKKGKTKKDFDEGAKYLDTALYAYGQNPEAYHDDISTTTSLVNSFKGLDIIDKRFYRIGITCPVSFSGNERQEMRSFPFDCMDLENHQKWLKHLKSVMEEEKEKIVILEHHFLYDSVKKYFDFFETLLETPSQIVVHLFESFDINYLTDSEVLSIIMLFDSFKEMGALELCLQAISYEVQNTLTAETLFRRNSIASKLFTLNLKLNALNYVHSIIKEFILDIVHEEKDYELDESKMDISIENKKEIVEQHGKELETLLEKLMRKILESKERCPQNLRRLFAHTRKCSEKFEGMELLNPGFIAPENYGILSEKPNRTVSRTLMLITKVLQNISNKVSMSMKEPFMSCMKDFTETKIEPIYQFLDEISDSKNVDQFKIESKTFTRQSSSVGKISKILKKRKTSIRDGQHESSITISEEMKLKCFHTLHKLFNSIYEKNAFKVPEHLDEKEVTAVYKKLLEPLEIYSEKKEKNDNSNITNFSRWSTNLSKDDILSFTKDAVVNIITHFKQKNSSFVSKNVNDFGNEKQNESIGKIVKNQLVCCLFSYFSLGLKTNKTVWDSICQSTKKINGIQMIVKNIDGQKIVGDFVDEIKFTMLICECLKFENLNLISLVKVVC